MEMPFGGALNPHWFGNTKHETKILRWARVALLCRAMRAMMRRLSMLGAAWMLLAAPARAADGPTRAQGSGVVRPIKQAASSQGQVSPQRAVPVQSVRPIQPPIPEKGKWINVLDTGKDIAIFSGAYLLFFLPSIVGRNKERAVIITGLNVLTAALLTLFNLIIWLWPVALWMALAKEPARNRG